MACGLLQIRNLSAENNGPSFTIFPATVFAQLHAHLRFVGGAFVRAVRHAIAPRRLESESEVKALPALLVSPG